MRPSVSVYIAVSIDQFIAREDGGLDWLDAVHVAGEDYGYAAFIQSIGALVMGRSTYDTALGFPEWPYAGLRVVVLTHRPIRPRPGVETHAGALAPLLDRLGAEGVTGIYLDGGQVIRQGLAEGVVDAMTLSVIPCLLGRGRPLWGDEVRPSSWRLQAATPFPSGLAQLRYVRA